ncbi:MAG TPA: PrsW family glutamic-type intramembrane protease [Streptosporangiaceae bacterium]
MTYPPLPQPAVPGPSPTYLGAVPAAPLEPWHKKPVVRAGLIAAAIGVVSLGGLIMLLVLGTALGVAALILAAAAAVLPLPFLILAFLWLDRYEPEPWHYLAFTFAWGACVATAAAYFVNSLGGLVIRALVGAESALAAVVVAPPVEETMKAAPLFLLLILRHFGRRQLNGVVDGIVYAGMSAVGFAFTENILYFGAQYVEVSSKSTNRDGLVALFWIFVLRGVFSPFAHPLFTCLTGIGVGVAVRSPHAVVRVIAPLGGLLLAITLHGVWNLLASSRDLGVIALGYLVIMVPAFIAMVGIAIWVRSHEAKVVSNVLPAYVTTGWLTPQEIAALSTMGARHAARRWARQVAGSVGAKAMEDYQFAATKLAILREGLLRGTTPAGREYTEQERELLNTIAARRQVFLPYGLPPVVGYRSGGYGPRGPAQPGYGPGSPVHPGHGPGGGARPGHAPGGHMQYGHGPGSPAPGSPAPGGHGSAGQGYGYGYGPTSPAQPGYGFTGQIQGYGPTNPAPPGHGSSGQGGYGTGAHLPQPGQPTSHPQQPGQPAGPQQPGQPGSPWGRP